jgi:hypothetical protein
VTIRNLYCVISELTVITRHFSDGIEVSRLANRFNVHAQALWFHPGTTRPLHPSSMTAEFIQLYLDSGIVPDATNSPLPRGLLQRRRSRSSFPRANGILTVASKVVVTTDIVFGAALNRKVL